LFTLLNLINQIDNFPTPLGPSSIVALPTEKDILESLKLPPSHCRCYIYDHTIISVIRHARKPGNSSILFTSKPQFTFSLDEPNKITLVIRDETGRYVWDATLNYNQQLKYQEPDSQDKLRPKNGQGNFEPEIDEVLLGTLEGSLVEPHRQHFIL
jgi:hypothetical protein